MSLLFGLICLPCGNKGLRWTLAQRMKSPIANSLEAHQATSLFGVHRWVWPHVKLSLLQAIPIPSLPPKSASQEVWPSSCGHLEPALPSCLFFTRQVTGRVNQSLCRFKQEAFLLLLKLPHLKAQSWLSKGDIKARSSKQMYQKHKWNGPIGEDFTKCHCLMQPMKQAEVTTVTPRAEFRQARLGREEGSPPRSHLPLRLSL